MGWGRGTWMEAFLVWRKRTPIDNYFFFMHLRHTRTAACVLESNNLKNALRFPGTKNAELQRVWKFLSGILCSEVHISESLPKCDVFFFLSYVSNSDFAPSLSSSLSRQPAGLLARGPNDHKIWTIILAFFFLVLQPNSRLCSAVEDCSINSY